MFGIFFRQSKPKMDSSDEDYLPDPERQGRKKKPPDQSGVGGSRGQKRKIDDADNQQRGLNLHDDFIKGKCFFIFKWIPKSK